MFAKILQSSGLPVRITKEDDGFTEDRAPERPFIEFIGPRCNVPGVSDKHRGPPEP
jgi:hypothetical protein